MAGLVALFSVSLAMQVVNAALVSPISFEKPFDTISAEGVRQIGANWDFGGSTAVNRHFIRLTSDEENKRGYVWSKNTIQRKEFSIVFTFRISGQREFWYGEGIGLWITNAKNFIDGDNHGFTGTYKGFGFVFDTFVNRDHAGGHQDVTFFENDGTRTLNDLNSLKKVGCMAPDIRYHQENAAFSPSLNMSRAKIQYKGHFVQVLIDAKNTGEWVKCYGQAISIDDDWIPDATIGVTSSTGSLADNHDVIALSVYDDVIDMDHVTADEKVKNNTVRDLNEDLAKGDTADNLRLLKRKYEQLTEDFEHQFSVLKKSMDNTIKKLREQEAEDSKRISDLELWVNGKVSEKVQTTIFEIRDHVEEKLQSTMKETAKKTSGWKTPFFSLAHRHCWRFGRLLQEISGSAEVAFVVERRQ